MTLFLVKMSIWKDIAQKFVDFAYEYLPVKVPHHKLIEEAKIVAYRGWHDD